jgi:membrane protease YdiL (CAAX protease family)
MKTGAAGGTDPGARFAEIETGKISLGGIRADATAPDFWPVAIICALACVSLGVQQFLGSERTFADLFMSDRDAFDAHWILRYKAWWVACVTLSFLVLPAVLMALLPGKRLRDCNLSWRGFREHFWIYVGLYAAVFPVIWLVSLTPTFTAYYPMYPQAGRTWFDLFAWEGMYIIQFVALEFFFRGFLVGGLGRHLGILAVPVSVMPYMMLHFSKPWPEAAASVVAGFVLGWLAWKTKSIWGGVCVHCAVAVAMDLLALSHKSQLPWLPR